jgi:hypothetical protein
MKVRACSLPHFRGSLAHPTISEAARLWRSSYRHRCPALSLAFASAPRIPTLADDLVFVIPWLTLVNPAEHRSLQDPVGLSALPVGGRCWEE